MTEEQVSDSQGSVRQGLRGHCDRGRHNDSQDDCDPAAAACEGSATPEQQMRGALTSESTRQRLRRDHDRVSMQQGVNDG